MLVVVVLVVVILVIVILVLVVVILLILAMVVPVLVIIVLVVILRVVFLGRRVVFCVTLVAIALEKALELPTGGAVLCAACQTDPVVARCMAEVDAVLVLTSTAARCVGSSTLNSELQQAGILSV